MILEDVEIRKAKPRAGISVQVEGRKFNNIKSAAKYYNRAYTHVIEMLKKGRSIEQALGLVKILDTLQSKNPTLATQWHPDKNQPLSPADVSYGSGRKVWWLCPNKHEWEATINSRNRGHGCPYCAGQKPTIKRNFATQYPELACELDSLKNEMFDPARLSPRSNIKVWWKCKKGHSWQATITNRTRKESRGSCPYCHNRMLCDDNSLARLYPDIAKDWHPTKNKTLTAHNVIAGGGKKVWWTCRHGHAWQATVGARVIRGTGCPKCSLQTSRIEIAVYTEIKALFREVLWREKIERYECDILIKHKNIGIEIDGVYWHRRPQAEKAKSELFHEKGILLFRLREEGLPLLSERDISFKWAIDTFPIISRLVKQILEFADLNDDERRELILYVNGNSLVNEKLYQKIVSNLPAPPPGESLADKKPELAKEWADDLNAPLSPEHFRPSANKKVWWRCKQGHTWKTTLNIRSVQNTGCPHCPKILPPRATTEWNVAKINPTIASEWNHKKNGNLLPEQTTPNSNKKVWWVCKDGHEWVTTVSSRNSGRGCPYCYGRFASETNNLATLYPDILVEWNAELNKGLNATDFTPHVGKKVWWKCSKGHLWQTTIFNRTKNKSGCPKCAQIKSRKYTIEYFKEYAIQRGGKCISTEYLSSRKKIKMICKDGHVFESRADNFLYRKNWCRICSSC